MISHLKKFWKKYLLWSVGIISFVLIVAFAINLYVIKSASGLLYNDVNEIPYRRTALVLGTSKYVAKGKLNLFYQSRMNAAALLYKNGKVKQFILSGDNATMSYNEPMTMKKDLVALGIPDSVLFLDYAGFRTLDAVIRAKKIFGQDSVTVISQKFHNTRAIFLAEYFELNAIGFNAENISFATSPKTYLREYFARVAAFMDLKIFHTQPKFLGEKVLLPK